MGEIYTGDFYDTIESYADKIRITTDYYEIGDEVHKCVNDIKKKISERLCVEFEKLVEKQEYGEYFDLKIDLYKIINEL